ncbi:MAG: hypothetical protein M1827_003384 [Pycnora praestabilis]|nr:MAG: hypothetical protein M1827_003384 [Pycnora praestabilis]
MLKILLAAVIGFATLSSASSSRRRPRQATPASLGAYAQGINGTNSNFTNVDLQITTQSGERNATAPLLYGIMFEDINHSGDGGIYGELITNRAFQGSGVELGVIPGLTGSGIIGSENPSVPFGPVLTGWRAIGDARLSLDSLHPLSSALPHVLQIDIPVNATGEVGFLNEGWWGMDVSPQTYNASFYITAQAARFTNNLTHIDVSLRSNLTNDVWITQSIPAANISTFNYTQLSTSFSNNTTAPNSNNTFAITFNATEVAGNTFYISLVSLFGETYKNRPNGLRKDLAEAFKGFNPTFLRFPGGNNLEGYSIETRWKWYETIGPLIDRPGRPGNWAYYNTDGLGLLEYLYWCEDMELEPILAVYAGYSLDTWGQNGTSFPPDMMPMILQEALDELEYCMGNTSTYYGAMRAEHGHPAPFQINIVEIGNEDWFSDTYPYRFPIMYSGLKAAYPNITYISTAFNEASSTFGYNITIPPGNMWDTHHYETPTYFLENFDFYDNWQETTNNTDVTVFLGEYSVFQIDTPSGVINYSDPVTEHIAYPRLLSAIAEGVYALGAERNPNVVKMQSYAPTLQNFNWYNWTPNNIAFTANPNETVLSVSYYEQQLFANYRGTQSVPVMNTQGDFNPLWWAATIDEPLNAVYLKVINSGNNTVPLSVQLDQPYTNVNGTIITNPDPNAYNYRNNQTAIIPTPLSLSLATQSGGMNFTWDVPGFSITVLQFDL